MKKAIGLVMFCLLMYQLIFNNLVEIYAQPTHLPLDEATLASKKTYTSLEEALQSNHLQVYKLRLEGKGYKSFPMEILKFRNLQLLVLHANQIAELHPEISKLKNLTAFYINQNQLKSLPKEIGELKNLASLELYQNKLKQLPVEFASLQSLTHLYLENNLLDSFPKEICKLKQLVALEIAGNKIKLLPKEIGNLKELQHFFCSRNKLSELPIEIGECVSLRFFNCNENNIKTLPKTVGNWENLAGISLSNNELSVFPVEIKNWKNLQYINCSQNQLKELPKEFFEWKNLSELYCTSNKLIKIPDEIGRLKNLKLLDLSENNINIIPRSIKELKNLENIILHTNQIKELPSEIGELSNLEYAYLQRNRIQSLPKEIAKLNKIKEISLADNSFLFLPKEIFLWLSISGNSQKANHLYLIYEAIQNNLAQDNINHAEALYNDWSNFQGKQYNKYTEAMLLNAGAIISLAKEEFSNASMLIGESQKLLYLAQKDTNYKMLDIRELASSIKLTSANIETRQSQSRFFWVIIFTAFIMIISVSGFAWLINRNRQKAIKAKNLIAIQRDNLAEKTHELETLTEELQQSNETLNYTFNQIEKKNEDITASINAALRIQSAILPVPAHFENAFGKDNYFVLFKPRDIVSGDFYFLEEIEDKIVLVCADCTGHGVPGAFMSMIGNQILTEIIGKEQITEPDQILNRLNKEINKVLKQNENQGREGMDVAVVTIERNVVRVDSDNSNVDNSNLSPLFVSSQTTKVTYAGAMNPIYYVQTPSPLGRAGQPSLRVGLQEIKADKNPIGGIQEEDEKTFTKHEIQLPITNEQLPIEQQKLTIIHQPQTINNQPETILYLCSDGFQDQFGGAQGKKFMVKRFRELLFSISHLSMHKQRQILDDTIEQWMAEGKEHQIDDILVVGVRV